MSSIFDSLGIDPGIIIILLLILTIVLAKRCHRLTRKRVHGISINIIAIARHLHAREAQNRHRPQSPLE